MSTFIGGLTWKDFKTSYLDKTSCEDKIKLVFPEVTDFTSFWNYFDCKTSFYNYQTFYKSLTDYDINDYIEDSCINLYNAFDIFNHLQQPDFIKYYRDASVRSFHGATTTNKFSIGNRSTSYSDSNLVSAKIRFLAMNDSIWNDFNHYVKQWLQLQNAWKGDYLTDTEEDD